ncbi:MAG: hypothetical protein M1836_005184 [Candelina mexicana]|nr:MAG: hypothetical protein M1836_005184 [Candelina mexicana]
MSSTHQKDPTNSIAGFLPIQGLCQFTELQISQNPPKPTTISNNSPHAEDESTISESFLAEQSPGRHSTLREDLRTIHGNYIDINPAITSLGEGMSLSVSRGEVVPLDESEVNADEAIAKEYQATLNILQYRMERAQYQDGWMRQLDSYRGRKFTVLRKLPVGLHLSVASWVSVETLPALRITSRYFYKLFEDNWHFLSKQII